MVNVPVKRDLLAFEADTVLRLSSGGYALFEVKLGDDDVDKETKHLLKIEPTVLKFNSARQIFSSRLPVLKKSSPPQQSRGLIHKASRCNRKNNRKTHVYEKYPFPVFAQD